MLDTVLKHSQGFKKYLRSLKEYNQPYFILVKTPTPIGSQAKEICKLSTSKFEQSRCRYFDLGDGLSIFCGEYSKDHIRGFVPEIFKLTATDGNNNYISVFCHNPLADSTSTAQRALEQMAQLKQQSPNTPAIAVGAFPANDWSGIKGYIDF